MECIKDCGECDVCTEAASRKAVRQDYENKRFVDIEDRWGSIARVYSSSGMARIQISDSDTTVEFFLDDQNVRGFENAVYAALRNMGVFDFSKTPGGNPEKPSQSYLALCEENKGLRAALKDAEYKLESKGG